MAEVVRWLVRYIATSPDDGDTRSAFSRLVSPELAGTYGIAQLLSLALDVAPQGFRETVVQMPVASTSESLDLNTALEELPVLIGRLPRSGLVLGAVHLDLQGLISPPRDLLVAVDSLLDRTAKETERESESAETLAMVNMLLPVGIALARMVHDFTAEYRLLRTAAMALAFSRESTSSADPANMDC